MENLILPILLGILSGWLTTFSVESTTERSKTRWIVIGLATAINGVILFFTLAVYQTLELDGLIAAIIGFAIGVVIVQVGQRNSN